MDRTPAFNSIMVNAERHVNSLHVNGKLGDHQVKVEQAQPRATSAAKAVLLEVKHFFTSVFGLKVTRPMSTPKDGANAVLHTFASKKMKVTDAMESLGALHTFANFQTEENRVLNCPNTDKLFRETVRGLSDRDLRRVYENLCRNSDLLEPMQQGGYILAMTAEEEDTEDPLFRTACGKVSDMGYMAIQLRDDVTAELRSRGHNVSDIAVDETAEMKGDVLNMATAITKFRGDVGKAANQVNVVDLNRRLEDLGIA